jgi:2-polyprenyl-6-methoxyphenol hydroxylase-like FAD-dependent oxidoreductase
MHCLLEVSMRITITGGARAGAAAAPPLARAGHEVALAGRAGRPLSRGVRS